MSLFQLKKVRWGASALFVSISLLIIIGLPSTPTIEWELDTSQSKIKFISPFLQASKVEGYFHEFSGKVSTKGYDFTNADAEVFIKANSLDTDNATRDRHLKSEDFIHAGQYAQIIFKSRSMESVADNLYKLTGDLTIRGTTNTVELDADHWGTVQDENGDIRARFKVTGEINRFDFNVDWSRQFFGGLVVGKMIRVECTVEFVTEESGEWEDTFTLNNKLDFPSDTIIRQSRNPSADLTNEPV